MNVTVRDAETVRTGSFTLADLKDRLEPTRPWRLIGDPLAMLTV